MEKSWKEIAREAQRKAVMDAALRLFESKGYIFTTMDEIAEKAGISKVTLYRLFPSKETLFLSIIGKLHEELAERMREVRGQDFPSGFSNFIDIVFENLQKRYGLIRILMNESMESTIFKKKKKELFNRIRKNRERFLNALTAFLKQGYRDGYVKRSPEMLSRFIFSIFKGITSEIPFHAPEEFSKFVEFSKERIFEMVGLKEVEK